MKAKLYHEICLCGMDKQWAVNADDISLYN